MKLSTLALRRDFGCGSPLINKLLRKWSTLSWANFLILILSSLSEISIVSCKYLLDLRSLYLDRVSKNSLSSSENRFYELSGSTYFCLLGFSWDISSSVCFMREPDTTAKKKKRTKIPKITTDSCLKVRGFIWNLDFFLDDYDSLILDSVCLMSER